MMLFCIWNLFGCSWCLKSFHKNAFPTRYGWLVWFHGQNPWGCSYGSTTRASAKTFWRELYLEDYVWTIPESTKNGSHWAGSHWTPLLIFVTWCSILIIFISCVYGKGKKCFLINNFFVTAIISNVSASLWIVE